MAAYNEHTIAAKRMHRKFHSSHKMAIICGLGKQNTGYRCLCGLRTYGSYPLDWSHDTALEWPCAHATLPSEPEGESRGL